VNVWKVMLFLIWGPVFMILTPYFLHGYFAGYLTGFVDYTAYILIFGLVGIVVADILTNIPATIITGVFK